MMRMRIFPRIFQIIRMIAAVPDRSLQRKTFPKMIIRICTTAMMTAWKVILTTAIITGMMTTMTTIMPLPGEGRTLSRISGIVIRQLTLILILAVSVYVTYTFWRASVPYGDIRESIRTKTFSVTLLSYLTVVILFLLFELISFFWAMTRVRIRDAGGIRKEDAGRGLTSFIIVFAASYLAFLFNRFVPSSPDVLYGLKGALLVFGSMHNTLLGLCAAGVISCLVRKYLVQ